MPILKRIIRVCLNIPSLIVATIILGSLLAIAWAYDAPMTDERVALKHLYKNVFK